METVEEAKELVVGKYYLVNSVMIKDITFATKPEVVVIKKTSLPIYGPFHKDPEINFDWEHAHIDWRFVESKVYKQFFSITEYAMPWQWVIHKTMVLAVQSDGAKHFIGQRAMKCKREFEPFYETKLDS